MEFIFDIPMLTNHGDEGRGRPHQTGNIKALVTGDGRVLVRHPNRFYGDHRLEAWPFHQLREGCQVGDSPDSPPYSTAVRVIESIKEILDSAPGQLGFDVLMEVLFDLSIGLFVITLQRQEIVTALALDLARDGRLASHRINGHNTPFNG